MRLPRLLKTRVGQETVSPETRAMSVGPARDPARLEQLTPEIMTLEDRIAMATHCRDADPVPKVPGAGQVSVDNGQRVQLMHNGVRVMADGYYGFWMTDLISACRGHHEPQEERVFHEIVSRLPPGGTMIELGGYWAFYTAWFLTAASGRRAVVVEPDPVHMDVGRANLALNGVTEATIFVSGFAGGTPGEVRAFDTEKSGRIDALGYDVPTLMTIHGMDKLTILHCDTQGAEFVVLEQATSLMQERRIDWVVVSTHHHSISGDPLTHQRCLHLLRGVGGTIVAEHDVQESFSGDGLIVARFCPEPTGWQPVVLSRNRVSTSLFRDPLYDLALTTGINRAAGATALA